MTIRYCSFCSSSEHEAAILVEAPDKSRICELCVATCVAMLAQHAKEKAQVLKITKRAEDGNDG